MISLAVAGAGSAAATGSTAQPSASAMKTRPNLITSMPQFPRAACRRPGLQSRFAPVDAHPVWLLLSAESQGV